MATIVDYWKPMEGVNPWEQPDPTQPPLGHSFREELQQGGWVPELCDIATRAFIARLLEAFPGAAERNGEVRWQGGECGDFYVRWSGQHVEITCFDLQDGPARTLQQLAEEMGYDWYHFGD